MHHFELLTTVGVEWISAMNRTAAAATRKPAERAASSKRTADHNASYSRLMNPNAS
jgi:hypothetical protein